MPPERCLGFAIVWLALVILSVDMIVAARQGKKAAELDLATVD